MSTIAPEVLDAHSTMPNPVTAPSRKNAAGDENSTPKAAEAHHYGAEDQGGKRTTTWGKPPPDFTEKVQCGACRPGPTHEPIELKP